MPPLTAELAGVAAVIALLVLIAIVVDPRLRARRRLNRLTRRVAKLNAHAARGCELCRVELAIMAADVRIAALRAEVDRLEALAGGAR